MNPDELMENSIGKAQETEAKRIEMEKTEAKRKAQEKAEAERIEMEKAKENKSLEFSINQMAVRPSKLKGQNANAQLALILRETNQQTASAAGGSRKNRTKKKKKRKKPENKYL